jgi:hypothetical protein
MERDFSDRNGIVRQGLMPGTMGSQQGARKSLLGC